MSICILKFSNKNNRRKSSKTILFAKNVRSTSHDVINGCIDPGIPADFNRLWRQRRLRKHSFEFDRHVFNFFTFLNMLFTFETNLFAFSNSSRINSATQWSGTSDVDHFRIEYSKRFHIEFLCGVASVTIRQYLQCPPEIN